MQNQPAIPSFSIHRAAIILVCMVALFITLAGRVAYLQSYGSEQIISRADRQQYVNDTLEGRRGGVWDSNRLLMAGTIQTETLFIDPKFMLDSFQSDGKSLVDMDDAINRLARVIDKDPFTLAKMLGDRSTSRFVKIAENLDDNAIAAIEKLDLPGVGVQPSNARYYPMGSLAAHILGGVGADGHGLDGLELRFDQILAGHDGYARVTKDARRRPIGVAAEDYLPPMHGRHLVLTIDSNIQLMAEQELAGACAHAKRGEVVVMDPSNGDVLALANYPTFNPQNPEDSAPDPKNKGVVDPLDPRRNNALVSPFEPGSTIKPFIAGPALMWKVTTPTEVWPVPGGVYTTPYGRKITDVHAYGPLCTWDGLVKSSNILMSMMGERLGNARLHRALSSFGFGKPTGIELPGESGGLLNPLSKWTKYSTESASQGYEIMVTPLQLARAMCVYANGGRLVQPRLVKGILEADGTVVSRTQAPLFDSLPQVIDPQTALLMRRILTDVPVRGTAAGVRSETWNVFGKTGTAHISQGKGGYSLTRFNSSFICGAPAENPRLVIVMIIHEPDTSIGHYGGAVAAPPAVRLMDRALTYLQVPPSPELQPPPPDIASHLWEFNPAAYARRSKPADASASIHD